MVSEQLAARGIDDRRVLAAMGAVPRELFVASGDRARAYADAALGIEHGQTISQPWIVAAIAQGLELAGDESLLEIGTGSGYSTAILARLAGEVISVERIAGLSARAAERLRELAAVLGSDEDEPAPVELVVGDGSLGIADRAPFDAIAVHAAVPAEPRALLAQLAPGGRLLAPVRDRTDEQLMCFRRGPGPDARISASPIASCRFVPMLGAEGFSET